MKKRTYILNLAFFAFLNSGHGTEAAKNADVPPKDEWRVCAVDSDCITRVLSCTNGGGYVAYNKKSEQQYDLYFQQKCDEAFARGDFNIQAVRGDPHPKGQCVRQRCEVAPEEIVPEEKTSYFERFKNWVSDLF